MSDGSRSNLGAWVDRGAPVASAVGALVLSFLAGVAVTHFGVFPYRGLLEPAFVALEARAEKVTADVSPDGSYWWVEPRKSIRGVGVRKSSSIREGYVVFTSMHESSLRMIDRSGELVHEWEVSFSKIWPDAAHVESPVSDDRIRITSGRVFPNGDAIVLFTAEQDTPYGYGLARVDADGGVVWRFDGNAHHDFTVADDGTIWVLTHRFRNFSSDDDVSLPGKFRGKRVLDDEVVHLSSDGEVLDRWSLTEVVARSSLRERLTDWHSGERWDLLHTNNVEPIDAGFARHHDFAEPGQLLVSFREIDTIALVDPKGTELVWWARGFWRRQHDPDPLPNGNVLLFDNVGYSGPGGRSRLAEFAPADGGIVWSYTGTSSRPFVTKWGGEQIPLANGNVLAVENLGSRLLEVDREGRVVWEYVNPARVEHEGTTYMPTMGSGIQFLRPEDVGFLER